MDINKQKMFSFIFPNKHMLLSYDNLSHIKHACTPNLFNVLSCQTSMQYFTQKMKKKKLLIKLFRLRLFLKT